jgi:hypothetical protein
LYWNPRTFWKNNLWFSLYIKNLQKMNGIVDPNFFCLKCQNLSATWLEIKKISFSNFNSPHTIYFFEKFKFRFFWEIQDEIWSLKAFNIQPQDWPTRWSGFLTSLVYIEKWLSSDCSSIRIVWVIILTDFIIILFEYSKSKLTWNLNSTLSLSPWNSIEFLKDTDISLIHLRFFTISRATKTPIFLFKMLQFVRNLTRNRKNIIFKFHSSPYHIFLKNPNFHFLENFDMKFEVSSPSIWSFKISLLVEVAWLDLFHPLKIP